MKTLEERMKKYGDNPNHYQLYEEFMRAKHQEYKRMSRLYKRAKAIASRENAYFITLTYDDEHIKQADIENCRKWCKTNCNSFFANDDYGKENGRIHHHVFGNLKSNKIDIPNSWEYGAINIKKFKGNSVKGITKYIDRALKKLSSHAVKNKTSNLIRSRKI
jgi:hypothetical protein